jgi:ubiquitin-protein ligase
MTEHIEIRKNVRLGKEKTLFEKTPSPYFGKREWFMEEKVIVMKQGFFMVGFSFPKKYPFYAPVAKLMRPNILVKENQNKEVCDLCNICDLYKPISLCKWSPQNKLSEVFDDYIDRFTPDLTKIIDGFEKNYILFFGFEDLPTDIKNLVFDVSILLILG